MSDSSYFEKRFVLEGAAAHLGAWKEAFTDKLIARYPYCLRDHGHRLDVNYQAQWVRVKARVSGPDVRVHTQYGSVLAVFGILFLIGAIFSLVGAVVSWIFSWHFHWFNIGGFIIAGILFAINEEFNIHDKVVGMAKQAWAEVQAKANAPAEVVQVVQQPGEKYPTAYIAAAPVVAPVVQVVAKVPAAETDDGKEALFCPFCGARHRPEARFCALCGAGL